MKHFLLLVSGLFLLTASASAQITLADTSYTATFANTNDSGSIAIGAAGVPVVTGGPTNALWDLSGVTYSSNDVLLARHNAAPQNYTYADFSILVIAAPYYYVDVRPLMTLDATGLVQAGQNMDGRAYGLGAVTGNNSDTINFYAQQDLFTAPHTFIKFPAAYNDNWSSGYSSTLYFTLNIFPIYSGDTGYYKSNITETDTVIGWGKMRVKNLGDTASGDMDVLQVKVQYIQVDSFFLDGAPAPDQLVTTFGLVQGAVTTRYSYKFYRRNEVTPLAEIQFADGTYSYGNTDSTMVHEQRLAVQHVGVANVIKANDISIYPNPVSDHLLNISVPQTSNSNWSYELVNILGQTISASTLNLKGQTKTQLSLPGLAPGIYYLHLSNNGQSVLVRALNVQ